ncbi:hypothetical protein RUM43_005377 [Polyplax serrata]|uniref:Small ribosomal subunit protein mS23 n=1 Tax=Polyplax serrata TaxID=468196 RepID=A0AAN8PWT9_POLSC
MGSRLEKFGGIYSRLKSLLRNGVISEVDKPLWFDIYTNFPPDREPEYNNPVDPNPVREIFYPEDKVRAKIHAAFQEKLGTINLSDSSRETNSQKWIKLFNNYILDGESEDGAVEKLKQEIFTTDTVTHSNDKRIYIKHLVQSENPLAVQDSNEKS